MIFNSYSFFCFLGIVLFVYYKLPFRGQNIWLLVCSYFFYGTWDWRFLSLIVISTTVDFTIGKKIEKTDSTGKKRALLLLSLTTNLGILSFFKYFNFFIDSLQNTLSWIGIETGLTSLNIILPVGISFYTFQTMSYTIDIYKKKLKPVEDLVDFSVFVSFFPQLVAGPIERASRFIPQVQSPRVISEDLIISGLWLVLIGLFKKSVIADNLAPIVDGTFSASSVTSGLEWWIATLAFTFQIYCDFSGYSDIARGISKLLGFELMLNFNLPYLATSPSDFWNRWHISLSTWLRDYLYIPLGGNRGTAFATYRNLMVTMLLGGLWHGAGWHFVLWGGFHGLILIIYRVLSNPDHEKNRDKTNYMEKTARISIFFMITCVGWLFFRAEDINQAFVALIKMFSNFQITDEALQIIGPVFFYFCLLIIVELYTRNSDDPRLCKAWKFGVGPIFISLLAIIIICLGSPAAQDFIYFQF